MLSRRCVLNVLHSLQSASMQQQSCDFCQKQFEIPDDEVVFLKKMEFVFGAVKISPPLPTRCPECRLQIRTTHRNERFLYRRKCDLTGADIVALYPAGSPYTVYDQHKWHSDAWDAMSYGKPYDESKSFFAQWSEMHAKVPRMNLVTLSNENSEFTTGTAYCKNCYLINSSENCEDCYYGKLLQTCRNCVDCSYFYDSELCYESVNCYNCYNCSYLLFSKNCKDCHFSSSLIACSNCFLCTNLDHKEYCFLNEQLTKEAYQAKVKALLDGSHAAIEEWKREWKKVEASRIHRPATIVNSESSTGDYIENCKNCKECFDLTESEDCAYCYTGIQVKDNYHCANMYLKIELCYEFLGAIEVFHCAYCLFCFYSQNMLYSEYCFNCKDCFGCNGLRHKQYCIFNVQYTKEEYEQLVPKIIANMQRAGEWGKYFPADQASFPYNDSLASEYFPLTKAEATSKGFQWAVRDDSIPDIKKTIPADQLPDRISEIPDEVLDWAIICERTKRPFKLTKKELAFYRQQGLPVPRVHPDVRYDDRLATRNPRHIYNRACAKCGKNVHTTFAPDRPETVYCEECYLATVY